MYTYRKKIKHQHHKKLRRRLIVAVFMLVGLIGGLAVVFADMRSTQEPPMPVSKAEQTEISDQINTFQSDFFKFSDRGKWVYSKVDSDEKKIVYYKYRLNTLEHSLTVWVDQTPIPLYLAVGRVLPVRMVNHNRLDATTVSRPCGAEYNSKPPRPIKLIAIENAKMLCDPDTNFYTVVLSEIGEDYNLDMRHTSGKPVQFVIQYRNYTGNNSPDTIRQIASTFEAL
jgi:hypothetical protein